MMTWLNILRTIDRLLELETKHGKLIEALAKRLDEITDRIAKLEAREHLLIAEAKTAAPTHQGVAKQRRKPLT